MSYLVFARKWRPQTFEEVVGQDHVTTTLKNAILQNRVAHAYLFSGPRGVGKTTTARIFAKALNCQKSDKPSPTPCNKCESCLEITEGRSLDVIEIDGASNRGIDEIRQLRENVKFAPSKNRYKVYIIDEVHQITSDGFNALLKTLEEPPAHVKFIFATTHRHKVIPTILSRCQRFDFKRVSISQLVEKLKAIAKSEKLNIDEEALFVIAKSADGSVRDAESILDQLVSFSSKHIKTEDIISLLGSVEQDMLFEITQLIIDKDAPKILDIINKFINDGKDPVQFVGGLLEHFRNLAIAKIQSQPTGLIDLPKDIIDKIIQQSRRLQLAEIIYLFNVANNTHDSMRKSGFARIQLEIAVIKLANRDLLKDTTVKDSARQINTGSSVEAQARQIPSQPVRPTQNLPSSSVTDSSESELNYILQSIQQDSIATITEPQEKPVPIDNNVNIAVQERFSVQPASLSLDDIRKVWHLVLNNIKTEKISAALFLLEGAPSSMEGPILTINFPQQLVFYKEALERSENRCIIEKYFKEALGKDIKVKFTVSDVAQPAPDKKALEISKTENEAPLAPISELSVKNTNSKDLTTSQILEEPVVKSVMKVFNGRVIRKQ